MVAGQYDVQIRDKSTGCIATKTVSITNALEADIALTTPLGCGGGGAEITIKVDNGSGDYEYSYINPGGTPTGPIAIPQHQALAVVILRALQYVLPNIQR